MGDAASGVHRPLNPLHSSADSALAGLWGGGGSSSVAAARGWDSGDSERQLRAMKSSMHALQMELAEARQMAERGGESEGRLRAQLQRVVEENDAALVLLGQVSACGCKCAAAAAAAAASVWCVACGVGFRLFIRVCSAKKSLRFCGWSSRM